MKYILSLSFFTLFFIQSGIGQSKVLDSFEITSEEISKDYSFSNKLSCQSIQAKTLYNSPDLYSFILGEVVEKRFQTIKHKRKKGSILFFEFDKDANESKAFVENLLWGGKSPNKKHPEQIIIKDKVMIILSFPYKSELGEKMIALIEKK